MGTQDEQLRDSDEQTTEQTTTTDVTEEVDTQTQSTTTFTDASTTETESDIVGVSDDELEEFVKNQATEITVVGCGGAGGNTVTRMSEEGITGATLVAANTDAQHLLDSVNADEKLLLGQQTVGGRGAGSRPKIGQEAAQESEDDIWEAVSDSDMVFVTAGMGGGTGTGAAPVVAEKAQEEGALTISVVSMPFTSEGKIRHQNAEAGLTQLREVSDTVIVVPNDRLLDAAGDMPLEQAFKVSDEVLMRSVKGITELITEAGLVNLDFSDVQTIMENGDVAMIGLGDASGTGTGSTERASETVRDALRSPLLDVDINGADSVLVNVVGGPDMSVDEAEGVVEELYNRVDPAARIIWGASVDPELEDEIRTMVVVTGVESPQIHGTGQNTEEEPETDIDYIE